MQACGDDEPTCRHEQRSIVIQLANALVAAFGPRAGEVVARQIEAATDDATRSVWVDIWHRLPLDEGEVGDPDETE